MYKCIDCKKIFDSPMYKRVCYEEYYGVSDLFNDKHYHRIECCPNCESQEIKELEQCECCGDYFDELIDTDGMINGGVGYLCEQCCMDNSINE